MSERRNVLWILVQLLPNPLLFVHNRVHNKETAFGEADVGSSAAREGVGAEGLVNNPDFGSVVYSDADNAGQVVEVALCQALGAVQGIHPDLHVLGVDVIVVNFALILQY